LIKRSRILVTGRVVSTTLAFGLLVAGSAIPALADDPNGGSSHNMSLVGTNDLQSRSTYQPTLHKYSRTDTFFLLVTTHWLIKAKIVCAPKTGLPPATVRTPRGLLGSVTSQISWAELA
jgi:hypothetical protein